MYILYSLIDGGIFHNTKPHTTQGMQEEEFVSQPLHWKGIKWPSEIRIQPASPPHPQHIMLVIPWTMDSTPRISHCLWCDRARARWTRTTFFLDRYPASPNFQIPILHSTVNASLTIHNPEISTSDSSNSKTRMFTPYSGNGLWIMATRSIHVQSHRGILLIDFEIIFT